MPKIKSPYEKMVNLLIPEATAKANKRVRKQGKAFEQRPGVDGQPVKYCFFSEFFHREMNNEKRRLGLIK